MKSGFALGRPAASAAKRGSGGGGRTPLTGAQVFTVNTSAVDIDAEADFNGDGSSVRCEGCNLSDFTLVSTGLTNPYTPTPARDVHGIWLQGTCALSDGVIDHLGMGVVAFGGDDDITLTDIVINNWGGGFDPGGNYAMYVQGPVSMTRVTFGANALNGDFSLHAFGRATGTDGMIIRDCVDNSARRYMIGGDVRTNTIDLDGLTKAAGVTQFGWGGGHQDNGSCVALNLDIGALEFNSNWEHIEISGTWASVNDHGGPDFDPTVAANWSASYPSVIVNGVTIK